jgi:hypothetical protein
MLSDSHSSGMEAGGRDTNTMHPPIASFSLKTVTEQGMTKGRKTECRMTEHRMTEGKK